MACIIALTLANSGLPSSGRAFCIPLRLLGLFLRLSWSHAFNATQDTQGREEGPCVAVFGVFLEHEGDVLVNFFRMVAEVGFLNVGERSIVFHGLTTPANRLWPD